MKILIIHYAYWITGGPERYLFNIKQGLEGMGHTVIPFSMNCIENNPSQFSDFFISPINSDGSWYFKQKSLTPLTMIKQIYRLFFSFEVNQRLSSLILQEKPDISFVLLFHKKMSPSVLSCCSAHGLPIVMRISDYLRICPKMTFYREGKICELCKKTKLYSIKYKCTKNSFLSSLLWFIADKTHNVLKIYKRVDTFIVTNPFMKKKLKEYGCFGSYQILASPVGNNLDYYKNQDKKKRQFCYVGNIVEHKGVDWLLYSFSKFSKLFPDYKLVIMGQDNENILKTMRGQNPTLFQNVEHKKSSDKADVLSLFANSLFSLMPAKWYENLPNTIIESFSVGTPVIATGIGSLNHMICNETNGYTFEYGNLDDMVSKMIQGIKLSENDYKIMQQKCINEVKSKYNLESHCKQLIKIFQQGLHKRKAKKA